MLIQQICSDQEVHIGLTTDSVDLAWSGTPGGIIGQGGWLANPNNGIGLTNQTQAIGDVTDM